MDSGLDRNLNLPPRHVRIEDEFLTGLGRTAFPRSRPPQESMDHDDRQRLIADRERELLEIRQQREADITRRVREEIARGQT